MNPVLALDPLFNSGDITWSVFAVVLIKVVVAFALLLVSVMLYIWGLRKVIADMQNRIGPNRAGPYGVVQTLADGIKLFFKEQSIPSSADRPVFRLAPYLSLLPAFLMFCIIPIGGEVSILGHHTFLQVADLPIGALWILAMSGIGVYGIMLAGWASGSKYPLLGSVRATAQLLSYEAAFGLAILGVLIQAGTLSTRAIVDKQAGMSWHAFLTDWYWIPAIVPFIIFLIAAVGRDQPPAVRPRRSRAGAGRWVQHRVLGHPVRDLLPRRVHERHHDVGSRGHVVPRRPERSRARVPRARDGFVNVWIMPVFWFMAKVLALLFCTVWVRASLPRMRYDRLMSLGWKYLIEIAILWALVSAALVVARDQDWNVWIAAPAAAGAALLAFGVLYLAMPKAGEQLEEFR